MHSLVLKKGREKSIERKHPWIFSGALKSVPHDVSEGDVVRVEGANGQFLAIGHYSSSSLAVKVLSFEDETIDDAWFGGRLNMAMEFRKSIGLPSAQTNAYRLVHGEGDFLPGLIIDVYDEVAVIQPHSEGMNRSLKTISNVLNNLGFAHVVHKPVGKGKPEVLSGEVSERTAIKEDGNDYHVDVIGGQKTGFFLDQRTNRKLLSDYAEGKSVLNVFSYTGGFSISALSGKAEKVVSLDASAKALTLAEENAQLNGFGDRHSVVKADAVPYLDHLSEAFDIIVLDPPAFAKHKSARHKAIQAYRRINESALRHLEPGGLLFTFSCSQVVDRSLFYSMAMSAAINAGKRVQVLGHLRQPQDHPVSLFHPEGEYLKGLLLRVLD